MAIVAMFSVVAMADTYKNKKTGEIIKGKLTDNKINDKQVFKLDTGGNKFIDPAEWEVIETSESAPKTDPAAGTAATTTTTTSGTATTGTAPKVDKTRVYILPIKGDIMSKALTRGITKALEEAKKKRCTLIVFHMDTPGGRIDVADDIIQLIEKIDWAQTVAWVEGTVDKGAISAGAYISLSTERIYMATGTTLGGAVPFHGSFGHYEVDEKMQSIFRARFRALAGKRGYPVVLADAMVDSSTSVVQVFIDGEQKLVSEEEAVQLQRDHAKDGKFKRGKTIVRLGKILTLTADEALEYGVAKALANDQKQLMAKMEIADYQINDGAWLTDWVTKTATEEKNRFEKAKNTFIANMQQAQISDPAMVLFPDKRGTKQWKDQTVKCMNYLKTAAAALQEIEKLANDPNADRYVDKADIDEMKAQLNVMYQRLGADING